MNFNPFIDLISNILSLYQFAVTIWIVLFWLIHFNIVNSYQPIVYRVMMVLNKLINPVLRKIGAIVPVIGGVDLSPIILFLLLNFIQSILYTYFYY
jgi:YggT family protein